MGEVDFLVLLVPFVHREVDDPAQLEAVLVDQPEFLAILVRAAPANLEILRLAGDEEHRVAILQTEFLAQLFGALPP